MNNLSRFLLFSVFSLAALFVTSCNLEQKPASNSETTATEHAEMPEASHAAEVKHFKYNCAHEGCSKDGSDEPGQCCGSDMVFNKEYFSDYICPMHCAGSGSDQAGTCPDCEMDYVENASM